MHRQIIIPVIAVLLAACSSKQPPADNTALPFDNGAVAKTAAPCAQNNPLRDAFFGDLHVHTQYSNDAYSFKVRLGPADAYRFAFGETVMLPPNDSSGKGTRPHRISKPLDFAAVTDHAEFFGEYKLCSDETSDAYKLQYCDDFRNSDGRSPFLLKVIFSPFPKRDKELCGKDGERCRAATQSIWKEIQQAAEDWHDYSSNCERTAFHAYEYSSFTLGSNLHRNVIFRNTITPPTPTSHVDAPWDYQLWDALERDCLDANNGCDVLAIPHNSNISNGRMFNVDYAGTSGKEEEAARALQRMRVEPIIEIMQHKGDSECRTGLEDVLGAEDELCEFEKFEDQSFKMILGEDKEVGSCYGGPLAAYVPHKGPSCLSKLSYVRYALTEGLKEEERLGVNPFKFGLSASTDTHNALAGGVEEKDFPGHLGMDDYLPEMRATLNPEFAGDVKNNPGGLIGIWAEENSRDSLFNAMQRKEVFGTSGPRIKPRLFAGWSFTKNLCDDPELVKKAYADGVPMGGDLTSAKEGAAPVFVTTAIRDPGTDAMPGGLLQRLQIIKGWVDDEGMTRQQVYDVAGTPDNGASVDPDSCAPQGTGHAQLCSVWQDPDFDAERRAVYYARAVENPSCRYSAWQCLELSDNKRPAACDSPVMPPMIQERAWTSPIWYTP
ncbi:MAG: DUF3604 domain-containing protein [Pseudomonadales bacterium]